MAKTENPEFQEKHYDAECIVCNWRYGKYSQLGPQGRNSFEMITKYGMNVTAVYNGKTLQTKLSTPILDPIDMDTGCVPIRIENVGEDRDLGADWCMFGSPISEIYNACIPRWWPKSWLYPNGKLADRLIFDLGSFSPCKLIVDCSVIAKPNAEVMNFAFADIYIEGIDEIVNAADNRPTKNDSGAVMETIGGNNMFGKKDKKTSKNLTEEEQLNEPEVVATTRTEKTTAEYTKTTVIENTDDPVEDTTDNNVTNNMPEENNMAKENETAVDQTTAENEEVTDEVAKKHGKGKKIPLWMKISGGVLIVGSLVFGTWKIVTTVKSKKDDDGDKKTPAKKSE